jgi:3-hydroxyacyl-CoA dehydrogenase/enoyl-CoA hydratase/3-hydroxybutyryl-CoA epimerase
MPVGPLAILDEVNLELTRKIRVQTQADLAVEGQELVLEPAFALIDKMCDEFKRAGKKDGAGFYDYPADGKKHLWSGLSQFVTDDKKQATPVVQFAELQQSVYCSVNP